jgi:hypothetical protein
VFTGDPVVSNWADLVGKGGHIRTIPVPDWVKTGIDVWMTAAGIKTGTLIRSINKAGRIWGNGFSPKVIWCREIHEGFQASGGSERSHKQM